jgi:hypothetical protein
MHTAKDIIVKPIPAGIARAAIRHLHYSGKVAQNSQLHLGVFLEDRLEGVMQFGPPLDKRKTLPLVEGTKWNGMLELNRMAFSDRLPRNSESRALGVAMRMIRKHYPHIDWIISFADATQCGDGTIYRAAGFSLVGIKANKSLRRNPVTGEVMQDMQAFHKMMLKEFKEQWQPVPGFQLRYIYFINPTAKALLAVPVLPYSAIDEAGAGMYKGHRRDK